MKTLDLVLKKKWYDMIASGEKTEEYREIKPYWIHRLCQLRHIEKHYPAKMTLYLATFYSKNIHMLKHHIEWRDVAFKNFDAVTFHLGYSKDRPSMTFALDKITIDKGKPEWGAEDDKLYFVIHLGKRL